MELYTHTHTHTHTHNTFYQNGNHLQGRESYNLKPLEPKAKIAQKPAPNNKPFDEKSHATKTTEGVSATCDPFTPKHKTKPTSNVPTSDIRHLTSAIGITLVSLVITIIVLIILAGITLVALMGENGLINKARMSKIKTNEETAKEEVRVIILEVRTENEGKASIEDIVKKLEQKPAVYIVRRESRYASLTESEDGKAITTIDKLDGTEKAIYVTNTAYDVEIKITADMQIAVTQEGEGENKSSLEEKQEEIDRLNKDIEDLLAQIAELNNQLQNSNSNSAELNKKITELQNQINQKNTEIANLRKQKDAEIANLNNQIGQKNTQITNLQNQIKNTKTAKVVRGTVDVTKGTYCVGTGDNKPMSLNTSMGGSTKYYEGVDFEFPKIDTGLSELISFTFYCRGQMWYTGGKFVYEPTFTLTTGEIYNKNAHGFSAGKFYYVGSDERNKSWLSEDTYGYHGMYCYPYHVERASNGNIIVEPKVRGDIDISGDYASTAFAFKLYLDRSPSWIAIGY